MNGNEVLKYVSRIRFILLNIVVLSAAAAGVGYKGSMYSVYPPFFILTLKVSAVLFLISCVVVFTIRRMLKNN
ncbi:hypothetical protein [Metaclostridioides mangenotii]|uniref:hypothetical protein n=1 Tax=Metaclostridioides mangenotii TaxID=1540 RepID=UPI000464CA14|nr:hypothetical protein [Clostridioides mangenotii]